MNTKLRHLYLQASAAALFWTLLLGTTLYLDQIQNKNLALGSIWLFVLAGVIFVTLRRRTLLLATQQYENQLRKQTLALEQSACGIMICDRDGNIEYVNQKLEEISGYPREVIIGQNPRLFKSNETPPAQYQDLWGTLLSEHQWHGVLKDRRSNGEFYWAENKISPVKDEQGKVTHFIAIIEDVTEKKHTEERFHELNENLESKVATRTQELIQAKEKAEAAALAKSEFLANMSHEIRTPMNAILGMTDLAMRTELSPKQREYLSKVRLSANSLLCIINDILDFSKIEAGKLSIEACEFDLQEVLDQVSAITALKAHQKGLEFLINTATNVPRQLIGDPLRLGQILINLCNNAIKFTDNGEIVVVTVKIVKPTPPLPAQHPPWITLRFSVRDTGIGMDESHIEQIFQAFSQGDNSTTRKYGGTGLGLAICKKLVALMGGEIGVNSRLGKGSDFYFTANFGLANSATMHLSPTQETRKDLRILVVDDSKNSRDIFASLLTSLAYQTTLTSSAAEGIAALLHAEKSIERPYDIVLMDWKMPEIDGFEATRQIRRHTQLRKQPKIIMVTAYGCEEIQQRIIPEQLDAYLTKPISASTLQQTLESIQNQALISPLSAPVSSFQASQVSANTEENRGYTLEEIRLRIKDLKVLLVDDNEINQQVAKELLHDVGQIDIVLANHGQEALERLQQTAFDLILMDLQMPVMDGFEATRKIRNNPAWEHLPIIAMTARAMPADRELCLAASMNDYISKPFDPMDLLALLAKWAPQRTSSPASNTPSSLAPPLAATSANVSISTNRLADSHLPGIDIQVGLHHSLNKVDLYEKLLRMFLDTRAKVPEEFYALHSEGQFAEAARMIHGVKSVAGSIGAKELFNRAQALETALETHQTTQQVELIQAFNTEHTLVITGLRTYFAQPATQ